MLSQNQFTENIAEELPRTRFHAPHNHKTTCNAGELVPIYAKEILPHDFISLDLRSLTKMTTPNFQTMDNLYQDFYFFFIPRRLLWKHWKNFQGEKSGNPREEQPEYTIPTTKSPDGGWTKGTIADHLEIPTEVTGIEVDSAYFRAYVLTWNEWFRDEFRQEMADFVDDDVNVTGSNGANYVTDAILGGKCLPVNKLHDYFTSTLLSAQDGSPVTLPLGLTAPVYTLNESTDVEKTTGLRFFANDGSLLTNQFVIGQRVNGDQIYAARFNNDTGNTHQGAIRLGLEADLSNATAATIAQLRMAFALQRIAENNLRSGVRYTEQLANRWGVTPPDASLQRPEYLGGKRIPLNIDMVIQTSSTDETSPLGQVSGFVNTYDEDKYFDKGFEEHGILLGFTCIRHQRTYQQGLHKKFMRRDMEDFYMPEFAHLGEQPVRNYQIFAQGTEEDNEVFGYQEYGAEYRFETNAVTGQFRSNAERSLDNWHYADDYSTLPVNGEEWIKENPTTIDRTLTIPSNETDQFQLDIYFDEIDVRSIPAHSIPGMMRM